MYPKSSYFSRHLYYKPNLVTHLPLFYSKGLLTSFPALTFASLYSVSFKSMNQVHHSLVQNPLCLLTEMTGAHLSLRPQLCPPFAYSLIPASLSGSHTRQVLSYRFTWIFLQIVASWLPPPSGLQCNAFCPGDTPRLCWLGQFTSLLLSAFFRVLA